MMDYCADDYKYPANIPDHDLYWECTLEDGHEGDHVADGREDQVFATWKRGEGTRGVGSR